MSINYSYTISVNLQTNVYLSAFFYCLKDIRAWAIGFLISFLIHNSILPTPHYTNFTYLN